MRWSEYIDVTLPNSVTSKEVEYQKMLAINVVVLKILVGKSIWGNIKLELKLTQFSIIACKTP